MAIVISSGSATSLGANTKSSDRVSGQYQHVGKGRFTLVALASATGMNVTCSVGGVNLVNDEVVPFTGTAGTIDTSAHVVASQILNGGRIELFFRNTTGGAVTTDHILLFEPMK
jgi:hypothetical protein|tara:strand:+ start:1860 stop:2201 length:342 start_codon:yes stop_codon:yes gene_type:complete